MDVSEWKVRHWATGGRLNQMIGKLDDKSTEKTVSAEEIIKELPKGLIKWYLFEQGKKALYITGKTQIDSALVEALQESGVLTDCIDAGKLFQDEMREQDKYDYVVIASALELTKDVNEAAEILRKVHGVMKESGKCFLGMNNRLGIRYFCGDRDLYTGRNFDSIEGYIRADVSDFDHLKGRSYAKAEIKQMLESAGFSKYKFYSVFPVLDRPQIMFADDYTPGEQLNIRIFPQYNYANTVFLEEETLYSALIQNQMFHPMANAFLVECSIKEELSKVNQVTVSMDRGRKNAMFTILHKDGYVEKKAVYEEGRAKLKALIENSRYLGGHGINMVRMKLKNDTCVMPYIYAQSALEHLRSLLCDDTERFLEALDELWNIIINSSEHVAYSEIDWENYAPGWEKKTQDDPLKNKWKKLAYGTPEEQESIGIILKRGYIDLIPLNSFYDGKNYIFYDQELYVENLPAKAIMLRTVDIIYRGNWHLDRIFPMEELKERYGLTACAQLFNRFIGSFLNELRNDRVLRDYHKEVRKNANTIHSNRQRMNYSADEYDHIFKDIFKGTENRELYLFGTGQFAQLFLSQFGNDCDIAAFVDNNPDKWNKDLEGIPICPPERLLTLHKGTYKVIICIKNYTAVMEQLTEMGISDFSVYDANLTYTRLVKHNSYSGNNLNKEKKKYNVGYIAGVFDLFHIGHLNLFKRAKEQCNYLIVGVVTDDGVIQRKHTNPYIPFEERIELVRSCKYVDEAVEIPLGYYDTDEAYRRYQFDVQFSGSDYADSPTWLARREFLRKKGSDLVFFPYTQSTSSTKIKNLINEKLL